MAYALLVGLLAAGGSLTHQLTAQRVQAATFSITTTDVDDAQMYVYYEFKFEANGDKLLFGDDGASRWEPATVADGVLLESIGCTIAVAGGDDRGELTCNPVRAGDFTFSVRADSGGTAAATASFTMRIAGIAALDSGSNPPPDSTLVKGQTNVPVAQFKITPYGEDIRLEYLKLYGVGTGQDTFDVERVRLYLDSDHSGTVSTGDIQLIAPEEFEFNEGFNPSVTFTGIGYVIDWDSTSWQGNPTGGMVDILLAFDFKATVDSGRTFRLTMENSSAFGWKGMTSGFTFNGGLFGAANDDLSAGSPYSQNNSMQSQFRSGGFPYKSNIMTIGGGGETLPTLYVTNQGIATDSLAVKVGEETGTLPLIFWSDPGHTIILDDITVSDSGSGVASSHIEKAVLYTDVNKNGEYDPSIDVKVKETTFSGDLATFSGLNISVATPSGSMNDVGAVYMLVNYDFSLNVAVVAPPFTYQGRIATASSVTGHDQTTGLSSSVFVGAANYLNGDVLAITSTDATAPKTGTQPDSVVYYDNDTNSIASEGDTILVTFDTNLASGGSLSPDSILLPVLGDHLGVGASIDFPGGHRMVITLGTNPSLKVPGVYAVGTHAAGSSSGLNLTDTATSISTIYGKPAIPADTTLDIDSAPMVYTASSSSSSGSGSGSGSGATSEPTGDAVCAATRFAGENEMEWILPLLRRCRDLALGSRTGNLLTGLYYFIFG